jgi:hypothetical protein
MSPLFASPKDGSEDVEVRIQGDDESAELEKLLRRDAEPYRQGWIEIVPRTPGITKLYLAYDSVARIYRAQQ